MAPEIKKAHNNLMIVGIGASAGGIKALRDFFSGVRSKRNIAYVVIQHLSQRHESNLSAILQRETELPVTQLRDSQKIEADKIYVIPPGKWLQMNDGVIEAVKYERTMGERVTIDHFFRTLADAYASRSIAVVLSGSGSDGTLGIKRIKEQGGIVIVQDPPDAEYADMPRSAISTGLVDLILPVAEMGQKIYEIKNTSDHLAIEKSTRDEPYLLDEKSLKEILNLLRLRTGHDFINYKRPTLYRRVERRLQVNSIINIDDYLKLLRESKEEVQALFQDLIISVTNFFRDPKTFQFLEQNVIPKLFKGKRDGEEVRVWIVGCATGEEAYSFAMLLSEHAEKLTDPPKILIFASDIDQKAISIARKGHYNENIEADLSAERIRTYFTREGQGYKIKKAIREMVLFAPHNILHDSPFSRLDLISCRNLLIYLNRDIQKKLLNVFNFSLKKGGYLLLGQSESTESLSKSYSIADKKHRIYISDGQKHLSLLEMQPTTKQWEINTPEQKTANINPESVNQLHYRLLENISSPSILVNEEYEILHMSENAGKYLNFSGGEPTKNLIRVIHPDLKAEIRTLLIATRHEQKKLHSGKLKLNKNGNTKYVDISTHPVEKNYYLVIIEDVTSQISEIYSDSDQIEQRKDSEIDTVVQHLEEELEQTRKRLRDTIEIHETSVEELKASNEELQAINEELRSTTEELETSKEELQSVNEELTTVNQELKEKVDELSQSNSDLTNFMASSDIGTLFLDKALNLRLFTPPVMDIFNIIPSDIGRPLRHVTHRMSYDKIEDDAMDVLKKLHTKETEVHCNDDRWYLVRMLPYRTLGDKIDGVVINFLDITLRKKTENDLRQTYKRLTEILESISDAFYAVDYDWKFTYVNKKTRELWDKKNRELMGQNIWDVFPELIKTEQYKYFIKAAENKKPVVFEIFSPIIKRWLEISVFPGNTNISVYFRDITERKESEKTLKEADANKDKFIATLAHELRNPLAPIRTSIDILQQESQNNSMSDKAVKIIDRQVNQMIHLVDDLLDVARINFDKIKLRKEIINLNEAVDIALEAVQPFVENRDHEINVTKYNKPLIINADITRIVQIIQNILNNAIKFTPKGGEINVTTYTKDENAFIEISDSGSGIAKEDLPNLFDLLQQKKNSYWENNSGLGIGLGVVKKLVEMHKGNVEVNSEGTGKGSTFVISLPISDKTITVKNKITKKEDNIRKRAPLILVVDDNTDASKLMKIALELKGFKVEIANDGKTGISLAKDMKPEIVLMDLGLPDISGHEAGEKIKKLNPEIKVIALTGWSQEEVMKKSEKAGFDLHLIKPVSTKELIENINRII